MVTMQTKTTDLVNHFLEDCRLRQLSPRTIDNYSKYLAHFSFENPELPMVPADIERWLIQRGESFSERGDVFKRVQAFYAYLSVAKVLSPSPIPRAKMGRPSKPLQPKPKRPRGRPRKAWELKGGPFVLVPENRGKLVGGGQYSLTINATISINPI